MGRLSHFRRSVPLAAGPLSQRELGEPYMMLEAARAFFVEGLSQAEVGERLGVSQTKVSRLLTKARENGVITFSIRPNPEHGLALELMDKLRRTTVKRVIVVPGGTGKNEGNLAGSAASTILDELARIRDRDVRITASGGYTIHTVFESMIKGLTSLPEWRDREHLLEFYPSAFMTGAFIDPGDPRTQVASLASTVNRAYGRSYPVQPDAPRRGRLQAVATAGSRGRGGAREDLEDDSVSGSTPARCQIRACAPSLPGNFYSELTDAERADYRSRFGIDAMLQEALAAQIFVVGIGRADDHTYRALMKRTNPEFSPRLDAATGEISFVPFDADGKPLADVEAELVAVRTSELRERAAGGSQQVIAVAGGDQKLDAIEAALIDPCFNTLVTDVVNARRLLGSDRVGKGA